MNHTFYKYQGTGNDFVIIDNRQDEFVKNDANLIAKICDRKFGVGADGLILLEDHDSLDFRMIYFNADGNESSMCGNGGRCIVHFANYLGIIENTARFEAIDGEHIATISNGEIHLQMQNVSGIKLDNGGIVMDTGSPHYVKTVENVKALNVKNEGAEIRYSEDYKVNGINVNFIQKLENDIFAVRTYERGVEDETLSCGTGVTAMALAMHWNGSITNNHAILKTQGGSLKVTFDPVNDGYENIWLIGPAEQVFKGKLEW